MQDRPFRGHLLKYFSIALPAAVVDDHRIESGRRYLAYQRGQVFPGFVCGDHHISLAHATGLLI